MVISWPMRFENLMHMVVVVDQILLADIVQYGSTVYTSVNNISPKISGMVVTKN